MLDGDPRHGTYAGVSAHRQEWHTPLCDDCRQARTEYRRSYRADRPDVRSRDRWLTRTLQQAQREFAAAHPDEFAAVLADVRRRDPGPPSGRGSG